MARLECAHEAESRVRAREQCHYSRNPHSGGLPANPTVIAFERRTMPRSLEVFERNDEGLVPPGWDSDIHLGGSDPAIGRIGDVTAPQFDSQELAQQFGPYELQLCHALAEMSQDAELRAGTARVDRGGDDDELPAAKRPRIHAPSNHGAPATGVDPAVRSLMVPIWMVHACRSSHSCRCDRAISSPQVASRFGDDEDNAFALLDNPNTKKGTEAALASYMEWQQLRYDGDTTPLGRPSPSAHHPAPAAMLSAGAKICL
jgi:hypothetical protein